MPPSNRSPGLGTTGSGVRLTFDARGYRSFGAKDGVTLAVRFQGGAILGSDLLETPRDDLFFWAAAARCGGNPTARWAYPSPAASARPS